MTWVKMDDKFFGHPKVIDLPKDAKLLYLCALTHCAAQLTDGFVSHGALRLVAAMVDAAPGHAGDLVAAGLWSEVAGGFAVHDYLEYNPSREQVLHEREQNAKRQQDWRERHKGRDKPPTVAVSNPPHNAVTNGATNTRPVPVPVPVPQRVSPDGLTGAPPHLAVAAPAGERPRLRAESTPAHDARWNALALALIEGTGTRPQTKSERTNHAAHVDQLWQLQPAVQADLVLTVCARYREEWPHISCTVKAILNNWGHFAKEGYALPPQRKGQEEPGGEEARAFVLMRKRLGQGEEPPTAYEAQYTVRGD